MATTLALDLGFSNTGYSIWEGVKPVYCGVCVTQKIKSSKLRVTEQNFSRSQILASALMQLIKNRGITHCIVEAPTSGAKSANALAHMMLAVATLASVLAIAEVPYTLVTPIAVKKVTGDGTASKNKVIDFVRARYPELGIPKAKYKAEHICDSVCAFLAGQEKTKKKGDISQLQMILDKILA